MEKYLYNICLVCICALVLSFQQSCKKQEDLCQNIETYELKCVFLDGWCSKGKSFASATNVRRFTGGTIIFNTCTQEYCKTFRGTVVDFGLFSSPEEWTIVRNGSYDFSSDSTVILLTNLLDTVATYHLGPDTAYTQTFEKPWIEQKDSFKYHQLEVKGVFLYEKQ